MWPQSRTIQEKEVTIVNSTECDSFYHRFFKIPSLIQIINSQMICAKDVNREQFCYVSTTSPLLTCLPGHLARSGVRAQERQDLRGWG